VYYANVGPAKGPALYWSVPIATDVLEAPDNPVPIGIATCRGCESTGLAWWRLTVHGNALPEL
jgi:hypothetical protein